MLNRLLLDHDIIPFHAVGTVRVREPIFVVLSMMPEDEVNVFLLKMEFSTLLIYDHWMLG